VKDERTSAYEGLFLFPQAQAANLQAAVDHLKEILAKAGAELISLRKWDERRLAYEIKGNKRGVYFLAYFRAPRSAVAAVERGCNLSEMLLRSMLLRAEHVTAEQMEAADGQAELADEIRLRGVRAAAARAEEASEEEAGDSDEEPVVIESDASRDAATAG
jgi:small subunit ribosomal protein S6